MTEVIKPATEYGEDRYEATLTIKDPTEPIWVDYSIAELSGDQKDTILTGHVKWDGCMETHGGYHTCSLMDIESIQQFLIQVYRKAYDMMGDRADGFGFKD